MLTFVPALKYPEINDGEKPKSLSSTNSSSANGGDTIVEKACDIVVAVQHFFRREGQYADPVRVCDGGATRTTNKIENYQVLATAAST